MAVADKQVWKFGKPGITDDANQFWVFGKPAVVRNGTVVDLTVKRFTADAILKATFTKTFTADAIVGQFKKSFTVDSILVNRLTKTFIADAVVVSRPEIVSPKDASSESSPVYLVFSSTSWNLNGNKKHFEIEVDQTSDAFGDIEINPKSLDSQTNWEYWDGDSWEPVPATGLDVAYFGNNVRYYATLSSGNKWWRIREIARRDS